MVESESELPPELWAMPTHIKESIVDYSDTAEKLCLCQVDFKFKEIVENSKIHYQALKLTLRADQVTVSWQKTEEETVEQTFIRKKDGFEVIRDTYPVITGEGDYRKAAVAKMFSVFKNSKVSVGELILKVSQSDFIGRNVPYELGKFDADRAVIFAEIRRILSSKNFLLQVAKLDICLKVSERMVLSVLQYLEPRILKTIRIKSRLPTSRVYIELPTFTDQITDTDQWKQLKEVEIIAFKLDAPFEKCLHLEKLSLRFSRVPTETMKTFLEIVLQKATIKSFWVWYGGGGFDMTGAEEYVDQFEKIPERSTHWRPCIKHPYEAGKRVEIQMTSHTLEIEKYDD